MLQQSQYIRSIVPLPLVDTPVESSRGLFGQVLGKFILFCRG
jgi:hypothetical protein